MKSKFIGLLRKYYWVPIVTLAILGSWWLGLYAWNDLHRPLLVDMFWSPALNMWEPVYYPPSPEWINALLLTPTMVVVWWNSPIYFQIPYALAVIHSLWLLWAYRPCIDVT